MTTIDELFKPIDPKLQFKRALDLPPHMTEMELKDEFQRLSTKNLSTGKLDNYLGAGVCLVLALVIGYELVA